MDDLVVGQGCMEQIGAEGEEEKVVGLILGIEEVGLEIIRHGV